MALEDIRNRVEEVEGVKRVYCANHSDPRCGNGDDELGWAEAEMLVGVGWKKVGDDLACSTYCAAIADGRDEDEAEELRAKSAWNDPITEEAVADLPAPVMAAELELSELEEFGGNT